MSVLRPERRREQKTRSPVCNPSSCRMSASMDPTDDPENWLNAGLAGALAVRPYGCVGPQGSTDMGLLSGVHQCLASLWRRGVLVMGVRRSLAMLVDLRAFGVTGGWYTRRTLLSDLSRSWQARTCSTKEAKGRGGVHDLWVEPRT